MKQTCWLCDDGVYPDGRRHCPGDGCPCTCHPRNRVDHFDDLPAGAAGLPLLAVLLGLAAAIIGLL